MKRHAARLMNSVTTLSLLLVFTLMMTIVTQPATAGITRHDRSDSQYRILANSGPYHTVGRIIVDNSILGSGTLIAPDLVLTAAHVVDSATNSITYQLNNGSFAFGSIAETYIHPQWSNTVGSGIDLAVFRLTSSITSVEPAVLYNAALLGSEVNNVGTITGYGKAGTGLTGDTRDAGTFRAGQNVIDAIDPFGFNGELLTYDLDDPRGQTSNFLGSNQALDLEYIGAPGDSGGGLFINVDNQSYLAGVNSLSWWFNSQTDHTYGTGGAAVRVTPFINWITGFDSSGLGQTLIPNPAPATAGMLLLTLILFRRKPANSL